MSSNSPAFERCQAFLKRFERFAESGHALFAEAAPFPHVVIDNIFDEQLLESVLREYPGRDDPMWQRYDDEDIQIKVRTNWKSEADIPCDTRELVRTLNSGSFLRALSTLTGIDNLISDPYLTGGGESSVYRGGILDIHCDGNWHDAMAVHRRLNIILYLNKNWQESWGGQLEFWDRKMQGCVTKIAPIHNRLAIFLTNDFTFHGHPQPLNCPADESRKSLILYYYTSRPREPDEIARMEAHRALWRNRGQVTGSPR
jgi:Rps23 Pro-64 3,4-dihydroxylase Tpa1-like proline 4-hydroxylase